MDHRCWESLKEMFTIAFKFVYSLFLNSEGGIYLPHIHSLGCSVHGASNSSLDCGHPAIELLFFFFVSLVSSWFALWTAYFGFV